MKKIKSRFFSLLLVTAMMLSMAGTALATESDTAADAASEETGYTVTFVTDEHVTIDVYYNKDTYESDASADPDETDVTSAVAREKGGTAIDTSGEGQVNFRINVEDGYEIDTNEATPTDNYKNYKGSDETGVEGIYRITKITGDITVTITTAATAAEEDDEESNDDDTLSVDETATEISSSTVWKYHDTEDDPAGDSTSEDYDRLSWTSADYDDSDWLTACGSFGAKNGAIASLGSGFTPSTLLTQYKSDGTNIEAFFFRTSVTIDDASAVTQILGTVYYDDSATIYINGVKIAGFDDSSASGTVNMEYYGSGSSAPKTGEIEVTDAETIASALVDGVNTIAVEVHNNSSSSSDIYFDLATLTFSTETEDEDEDSDSLSIDSTATEINSSTVWKYHDTEDDPAGDSTSEDYDRLCWTLADYDDSSWSMASGSFGAKYGEIANLGNDCTPDNLLTQYKSDGSTDIEAYFFRTTVTVEDASAVTQIVGSVTYDDSATIYINGTRIAGFYDDDATGETNMEYYGSGNGSPVTSEISVTDAETIASALVDGENTIAVEVHNQRSSSSDIYFELTSLTFSTEAVEEDAADEEQSGIALAVGVDETERRITWYYDESGTGTLTLAKESDLVDGEMPSDAATYTATGTSANKDGYYYYQVTMSDLEESTTYAYQLTNGDVVSEIYTFEIGADDGSFTFALAGDPQIGTGNTTTDTEGWCNTLDIVSSNSIFDGIEFLLSVGDQVDTASDEDQYDGFLSHSSLTSLSLATVIGNHDTGSAAYSQHFNTTSSETNTSSYGSTTAGSDYYYVYEGVLFLVLNSNNTSTSEHQAFMEAAIAEAEASYDISWKVVTFHHSIYSVASHSLEDSIISRRNALVPIFEELDIDVVLMGHDHVYARTYIMDGLEVSEDEDYEYDEDGVPVSVTNTDGILYVTANSASGSKYYDIKTSVNFEYAAVMNQDYTPNISLVTVTEDSFTVTTYETSGMSQIDTFTIYREEETGSDTDDTTETSASVTVTQSSTSGETVTETLTLSTDDYAEGTSVTLSVAASDGYILSSLTVTDSEGSSVTVTSNDDGTYAFTMPSTSVTVTATFTAASDDNTSSGGETTDDGTTDDGTTDDGTTDDGTTDDGTTDDGTTDDGTTDDGTTDDGTTDDGTTDDGTSDDGTTDDGTTDDGTSDDSSDDTDAEDDSDDADAEDDSDDTDAEDDSDDADAEDDSDDADAEDDSDDADAEDSSDDADTDDDSASDTSDTLCTGDVSTGDSGMMIWFMLLILAGACGAVLLISVQRTKV